jgi:hypothetical protein
MRQRRRRRKKKFTDTKAKMKRGHKDHSTHLCEDAARVGKRGGVAFARVTIPTKSKVGEKHRVSATSGGDEAESKPRPTHPRDPTSSSLRKEKVRGKTGHEHKKFRKYTKNE